MTAEECQSRSKPPTPRQSENSLARITKREITPMITAYNSFANTAPVRATTTNTRYQLLQFLL